MIVGLVSWYDENPDMLADSIGSMRPFVDQVLAFDGAYALYPGGKAKSPKSNVDAIRSTGIPGFIYTPDKPWPGNEVEKRATMFEVGGMVTGPDDWYFVLDGDERITDIECDVPARLAATEFDVATATCWQHRETWQMPGVTRTRKFFRAITGLTVRGNHFTYVAGDRYMWALNGQPQEAAEDLPVRIEHRKEHRDRERLASSNGYYGRRRKAGIEPEDVAP